MNKRLMTAVVAMGVYCLSVTNLYATPMQLVYDGKTHYYDLPPITMYINGAQVDTSLMPPVQIEDTTLVPVREIFEPMGAFVEWKADEKKVYIDYNNTLLILEMNNRQAWKNGEIVEMHVPAKVINDKIMVPVRFISEQIGFEVQWMGESREIYIKDSGKEEKPEIEEPEIEEPEVPLLPEDDVEEPANLEELLLKLSGVTKVYEGTKNKHRVYVTPKDYARTNIAGVNVTTTGEGVVAVIQASSPITAIESFADDGKIVIDIVNGNNGLSSNITPNANGYISKIRTSQFTKDTTRVVFDLSSGAKSKVTLSEDRMSILLELQKQPLEGLVVGRDSKSDYIALNNIAPNQIKVDEGINQITLGIDNVNIGQNIYWDKIDGEYISDMEITNTSRGVKINIGLHKQGGLVQMAGDKGDAIIRITSPSYKNIGYNAYDKTLTLIGAKGLSARDIAVTDQYRERKMILDLGANYSEHFGDGSFTIGDSTIKDIQIITDRTTKLIINEATIQAVNIKENGEAIQIKFVKPSEKYEKLLVLDAGHGGNDGGTSGNGLKEKEISLKQTMAVKQLIEDNTNIKVYLTREVDTTLTLAFRTELANEIGADMFVSIHNNSASAAANGTEVLYYPNDVDKRSKQLAQLIQTNLINATGMTNRGVKSRPDLYVLRTSKMPAVLIEGGFLTNAGDAEKLASEDYTRKYAYAVYEAIVMAFDTLGF